MKQSTIDQMKLAAKAIGQKVVWIDDFQDLSKVEDDGTYGDEWNPWLDNKDSLRLIAELRLAVAFGRSTTSLLSAVRVWKGPLGKEVAWAEVTFAEGGCAEQAMRDAVLMVASDIGKKNA